MINILSHQRNANRNDSEIPSYICQKGSGQKHKWQLMLEEDVEQGDWTLLHCWWNACVDSHFSSHYGSFSKKWESMYARPSSIALGHIPKGCSIIPQGHLLNYVHSSIIHNNQNLETTLMSINGRMDKENVVNLHNGILLSCKKNNDIMKLADK